MWTLLSLDLDMSIVANQHVSQKLKISMANSVAPDEIACYKQSCLVYTVCKGICSDLQG